MNRIYIPCIRVDRAIARRNFGSGGGSVRGAPIAHGRRRGHIIDFVYFWADVASRTAALKTSSRGGWEMETRSAIWHLNALPLTRQEPLVPSTHCRLRSRFVLSPEDFQPTIWCLPMSRTPLAWGPFSPSPSENRTSSPTLKVVNSALTTLLRWK